jgi:precorrin-6A/cobalt-precorrin-6A reductase
VILLLGGTSETAGLAAALQDLGLPVLVSTATDAPLALPAGTRRRCGRLDAQGLAALLVREGLRAVVDGSHPFATELHAAARAAATAAGLPLFRFERPDLRPEGPHVRTCADHAGAAALACALAVALDPPGGRPVLLSTGSRHLAPYVREARRTGLALYARVLDAPESLAACEAAGLPASRILALRGPFDLATQREHLRRTGAGVLVAKASGLAGGLDIKAEAARLEGVLLVLVARPEAAGGWSDPHSLAAAVAERIAPAGPGSGRP